MNDVVARRRGGFVAVGYDRSDAEPYRDAAVWLSPDGLRWSRVPNGDGALGNGHDRDQVMDAVTETPSGLLVAVGRDRAAGAVWTSTDGRHWARTRSPGLQAAGSTLELQDVVAAGSRLVAVGRRGDPKGNLNEAAVWLSTDGRDWRRVRSPVFEKQSGGSNEARGQQMRGVVAVPFGFVAVGADHPSGPDGPAAAAVWTSLDGEVWTPVGIPSLAGPGNYSMRGVARDAPASSPSATPPPATTARSKAGRRRLVDAPGLSLDPPRCVTAGRSAGPSGRDAVGTGGPRPAVAGAARFGPEPGREAGAAGSPAHRETARRGSTYTDGRGPPPVLGAPPGRISPRCLRPGSDMFSEVAGRRPLTRSRAGDLLGDWGGSCRRVVVGWKYEGWRGVHETYN